MGILSLKTKQVLLEKWLLLLPSPIQFWSFQITTYPVVATVAPEDLCRSSVQLALPCTSTSRKERVARQIVPQTLQV